MCTGTGSGCLGDSHTVPELRHIFASLSFGVHRKQVPYYFWLLSQKNLRTEDTNFISQGQNFISQRSRGLQPSYLPACQGQRTGTSGAGCPQLPPAQAPGALFGRRALPSPRRLLQASANAAPTAGAPCTQPGSRRACKCSRWLLQHKECLVLSPFPIYFWIMRLRA